MLTNPINQNSCPSTVTMWIYFSAGFCSMLTGLTFSTFPKGIVTCSFQPCTLINSFHNIQFMCYIPCSNSMPPDQKVLWRTTDDRCRNPHDHSTDTGFLQLAQLLSIDNRQMFSSASHLDPSQISAWIETPIPLLLSPSPLNLPSPTHLQIQMAQFLLKYQHTQLVHRTVLTLLPTTAPPAFSMHQLFY